MTLQQVFRPGPRQPSRQKPLYLLDLPQAPAEDLLPRPPVSIHKWLAPPPPPPKLRARRPFLFDAPPTGGGFEEIVVTAAVKSTDLFILVSSEAILVPVSLPNVNLIHEAGAGGGGITNLTDLILIRDERG